MSIILQGGCRCGQVHYTSSSPALDVRACHCRDCQYASGSAFSTVAYFPRASIELQGPLKAYSVTGSDGLTVNRSFCSECGTPVCSELAELPDLIFIKVGTLEDPNSIELGGHMWWQSKVDWLKIADDLEKLPANPPL